MQPVVALPQQNLKTLERAEAYVQALQAQMVSSNPHAVPGGRDPVQLELHVNVAGMHRAGSPTSASSSSSSYESDSTFASPQLRQEVPPGYSRDTMIGSPIQKRVYSQAPPSVAPRVTRNISTPFETPQSFDSAPNGRTLSDVCGSGAPSVPELLDAMTGSGELHRLVDENGGQLTPETARNLSDKLLGYYTAKMNGPQKEEVLRMLSAHMLARHITGEQEEAPPVSLRGSETPAEALLKPIIGGCPPGTPNIRAMTPLQETSVQPDIADQALPPAQQLHGKLQTSRRMTPLNIPDPTPPSHPASRTVHAEYPRATPIPVHPTIHLSSRPMGPSAEDPRRVLDPVFERGSGSGSVPKKSISEKLYEKDMAESEAEQRGARSEVSYNTRSNTYDAVLERDVGNDGGRASRALPSEPRNYRHSMQSAPTPLPVPTPEDTPRLTAALPSTLGPMPTYRVPQQAAPIDDGLQRFETANVSAAQLQREINDLFMALDPSVVGGGGGGGAVQHTYSHPYSSPQRSHFAPGGSAMPTVNVRVNYGQGSESGVSVSEGVSRSGSPGSYAQSPVPPPPYDNESDEDTVVGTFR